MGALKNIRVREGTSRDIGLMRKLWAALLEQNAKDGSAVLPTEQSLRLYEGLFTAYVEQKAEGVVFFVADRGVVMVGSDTSGLEYAGKTAVLWGINGGNDDRIQDALLARVDEWALAHEIRGLITQAAPLEGFEPVGTIRYRTLPDG